MQGAAVQVMSFLFAVSRRCRIWQTTDHRPQTTDHRPQTTDHRPQTEDNSKASLSSPICPVPGFGGTKHFLQNVALSRQEDKKGLQVTIDS
jgi:hypothetical protein